MNSESNVDDDTDGAKLGVTVKPKHRASRQ